MKQSLTDQEKIIIVEKYLAGMSTVELAKEYNRDKTNIREILKRRNIPRRNYKESGRRYSLNQDFFNRIETEGQAYFLGLLYADGHISSRKRKNHSEYSVHIALNKADIQILETFNENLQSNKPLEIITPKLSVFNGKSYPASDMARINIYSQKMYFDLQKLGCIENKSLILKFPTEEQVPNHLIHHFMRGYFDGDGCIVIHSSQKYPILGQLSLSGTVDFLTEFNNILKKFGSTSKAKISTRGNIFILSFGGNFNVERIANILYKDSTIFLNRKKEKINKIFHYCETSRNI